MPSTVTHPSQTLLAVVPPLVTSGQIAAPCAAVDIAAFDHNAEQMVGRSRGLPIRVASKSLRSVAALRRALDHDGFQGILAYSVPEAIHLAQAGFDDIVVAYPCVNTAALRELAADQKLRETITVMVDCTEHLELIEAAAQGAGPVRVAIDLDCTLHLPGAVIGPRRSPVRTPGDKLAGIIRVDTQTKRVRFLAGTRLHRIPEYLQPFGLALANQGDIDVQSVAGAISTSTHGTGIEWTGFAGTVTGISLIDASGERRDYSIDTDPDMLRLVTVSLGALGVIVEVEMQCVDAFDLLAEEGAESLDAVLDSWEERSRAVDHYEAFWFPHTDRAMVKSNTRLVPGAPAPGGEPKVREKFTQFLEDDLIGNGAFAAVLAIARAVPKAIPLLNTAAAGAMAANRYRSRAHDVFATPRRVRFHETEFAVPLEDGPEAVREIRRELDRRNWLIPFPLELRTTAADDVALSTSTGRESMYIAFHVPRTMNPHEYFPAIQDMLKAADGRPHWGKMHTLSREDFAEMYPRFDEFCTLREQMDPTRKFGSDHLTRLFG